MSTAARMWPVRAVPLKELAESPDNPRSVWGDLEALGASIRSQGILEPLLVRKGKENGAFEIVAGARRARAAKLAGLAEVPCQIAELTDTDVAAIRVIENFQREGLTPLDEAKGYQQLLHLGLKAEVIARDVGVAIRTVYNRLQLLKLARKVQEAVAAGTLTPTHGEILSRVPGEREQVQLASEAVNRNLSSRDLDEYIRRELFRVLSAAPWKKDDASLVAKAGACTACPKRTTRETHPGLKPDTCLDVGCYRAKLEAHHRRRAEDQKLDLARLSTHYSTNLQGVFGASAWTRVADKAAACPQTAWGVVVESYAHDPIKEGVAFRACLAQQCPTHRSASRLTERDPREAKRQRAAMEKARVESAVHKAVFDAILDRVRERKASEARAKLLPGIARTLVGRMWHEGLKSLFRRHGWEPKKGKYGVADYHATLGEQVKAMKGDPVQLFTLLTEASLIESEVAPSYRGGSDGWLDESAALIGVPAASLRRRIEAEHRKAQEKKRDQKPKAKPTRSAPSGAKAKTARRGKASKKADRKGR